MKVHIKDIMDALEGVNADTEYFYGIKDGVIYESIKGKPEYGLEEYIPLPTDRDINKYNIMRYFAYTLEDEEKQDELLKAIRGEGAFKRFRETVATLQLKTRWRKYLENELEDMAREWCFNNDIRLVE